MCPPRSYGRVRTRSVS